MSGRVAAYTAAPKSLVTLSMREKEELGGSAHFPAAGGAQQAHKQTPSIVEQLDN
jgi:hypothetical protein